MSETTQSRGSASPTGQALHHSGEERSMICAHIVKNNPGASDLRLDDGNVIKLGVTDTARFEDTDEDKFRSTIISTLESLNPEPGVYRVVSADQDYTDDLATITYDGRDAYYD